MATPRGITGIALCKMPCLSSVLTTLQFPLTPRLARLPRPPLNVGRGSTMCTLQAFGRPLARVERVPPGGLVGRVLVNAVSDEADCDKRGLTPVLMSDGTDWRGSSELVGTPPFWWSDVDWPPTLITGSDWLSSISVSLYDVEWGLFEMFCLLCSRLATSRTQLVCAAESYNSRRTYIRQNAQLGESRLATIQQVWKIQPQVNLTTGQ